MNNKRTILTIAPITLAAALLLIATTTTQFARAEAGWGPAVPFDMVKDKKTGEWVDVTNKGGSASAAKSDSASSANSQNNVKCFAFCLGVSTANSGSAANSDSRTNSPGDTATAQPVSPQVNSQASIPTVPTPKEWPLPSDVERNRAMYQQPDTPQSLQVIQQQNPSATTACIDNTGSAEDNGYAQGYVDGNRDSVGLNGHGFDDSLKGNHTPEFRQGYHDGYHSGFTDGKKGINLQQC